MKIEDIILQLAIYLPQNDASFTDDYGIRSIVRSSDEFIVNLESQHNFEKGHGITISGTDGNIAIATFVRTDPVTGTAIGTITTTIDHDLTKGVHKTVTVSGSSNVEFNGTFTVINIVSKTIVTVIIADTGPLNFGSGGLLYAGGAAYAYDATYGITRIVSNTSFAIKDDRPTIVAPIINSASQVRARPRISGGVSLEKFIAMYTKQADGKWWMFVLLEDVFASKDRDLRTDSIAAQSNGEFFRQIVIQPFTLYVIKDVQNDVAGRSARDDIEDMFQGICKSTLWTRYQSYFGVGVQGNVHFMSHGIALYDSAVYVHAFSFQQSCDLSELDTVAASADISFKKFSLEASLSPISVGLGSATEVDVIKTANVLVNV